MLHEARIIGSAFRRVAEVLVDEFWDVTRPQPDPASLIEPDMARMERLLLDLLRRQLVAVAYQRAAMTTAGSEGSGPKLAIGFTDLEGYTALSHRLDDAELSRIVGLFEELAFDLVSEFGGRVVKTIGDEVMFSCPDPASAAHLSLRLVEAHATGLPRVRVALEWGSVVLRGGDCYGDTVNLSSRIARVARAGEAHVAAGMRGQLEGEPSLELLPLSPTELKDFGPTELWRVVHRRP